MTRQLTVTLGQAYDADGNRTQLTYPDGVHFDYAYDSLNHLQQINENGGAVGTITAKTDRATPSWAGLVTPTGLEPVFSP